MRHAESLAILGWMDRIRIGLALFAVTVVIRRTVTDFGPVLGAPWWMYLGGLLGAGFVLASVMLFTHALRHEEDYIFGPDMGTDETCMAWIKDEIGRSVGLPAAFGGRRKR